MANRCVVGTHFGHEYVIQFRGRQVRNVGHMDTV